MLEALDSCDNKKASCSTGENAIRQEALILWISRYSGNNPVYSE